MPQSKTTHSGPTPYLCCKGALEAIAFYERALGAVTVDRFVMPDDGRVGHAELEIGRGTIMLADEWPEIGFKSPLSLGGSPVMVHLEVADIDASIRRAEEAGAKVLRDSPKDENAGRRCTLGDPFGHVWIFSQAEAR